ncbi:MAG: 1-deoxy-D-xylulose-5-phosphate reductoisomerase [Candidatus Omnitrophica bacterium]|nr:1-deoxy-D-xylulose-5-phosphate reductoisomerase [Candidatus Omnitrophota bacterium]
MMKRIVILGSTGSIGRNTLKVIRAFPKRFSILGLSTNSNIQILYQQIKEFHPEFVGVKDINAGLKLKANMPFRKIKLFLGEEGLIQMLKDKRIDQIVLAISGSGALLPLLKAIESKIDIALANKEAMVMAGSLIMNKAKVNNVKIIPIDSEQSGIWQCLNGEEKDKLKNIYLTASGGPFRLMRRFQLKDVSIQDVLRHPRWKMGKKNSVDSATLMNKGLEILETMFLFDVPLEKIKVIIHPEAVIHSMVEFVDGVIFAQLSIPDMRIPIQHALSYPQRLVNNLKRLDFFKLKTFNFERPDLKRFPCLALAYRAAQQLGTMPAVLNAANEVSVEEFLKKRLKFICIPEVVKRVLEKHANKDSPDLEDILEADNWARMEAYRVIRRLSY